MRILFCGGGTAGHVNPALAIAQTVMRNSPDSAFAYVATNEGIENKLVPFKKYHINVTGLKRSLSLSNVKAAYLTLRAIGKSKKIIEDFQPDIIIGTGGYSTYPVIFAGSKLGIKTAVHESNAIPGKAIKMLQSRVDRIFVNFEETSKYFDVKDKVVHTGNPLRNGFNSYERAEARRMMGIKEKYVVLCYGGSLGASRVNDGALELIENLISDSPDVLFIWASGKREYGRVKELLHAKKYDRLENLRFSDYIYDMPEKVAAADIVICRAGAMSVSEMASSGKCTIFIPSPNVTDNHQYKNAKIIGDAGAATVITEDQLYKLTDTVKELLSDDKKRLSMAKKIRSFSVSDANKRIYKEILSMTRSR